jgi:sulfur relay (sulfurtransferase) DsrC/TusE family protein
MLTKMIVKESRNRAGQSDVESTVIYTLTNKAGKSQDESEQEKQEG